MFARREGGGRGGGGRRGGVEGEGEQREENKRMLLWEMKNKQVELQCKNKHHHRSVYFTL